MPSEAESVRSESIRFNDFRPSLQVVVVNSTNKIGLGEIQLVIAAIDENPFCVEQRSHGAVTETRGPLEPSQNVIRHMGSIQDERRFLHLKKKHDKVNGFSTSARRVI